MRPSSRRKLCAALMATSLLVNPPVVAEDIDLFTNPASTAETAPNILVIVDNSANWNRNDQGWVDSKTGLSPFKQGQSELRALRSLMDDPNMTDKINFGLMMLSSGVPNDSAYIRFQVQPMTAEAKKGFKEMIGDNSCVDGANSYNGTPNCIFKNFNKASEQTNSASTRYSGALFEAFKYFGGFTDPANANKDIAGTPVDRNHFGNERYGALSANTDKAAWADPGTQRKWMGPIKADGSEACAKNHVIFIGNGYPSQDVPDSLLTGIYGNVTSPAGIGNKAWKVANWAKYINQTDVNAAAGRQNVTVHAIDVFLAKPDPANQTAMLKAMAKFGGDGVYKQATSEDAILDALRTILTDIQSVNSVFASASLPINATNRSQNENQVFIGMFRPDPKAKPLWYGNLKQFQIAFITGVAQLADKDSKPAVASSTGFIQPCATSFWTTDSGKYWSWSPPSAGSCTLIANSADSDLPDGGIVEKGGAAEVLRKGNNPSAVAPFSVSRTMYSCGSFPCASLVPFDAGSATPARTATAAAENATLVRFTRGEDTNDENLDGNLNEPRPSIHADIAHSRPLPVNYGKTKKVVVYYGSNDGPLRAVQGATGKELWSFIAPDHHAKLRRLWDNKPLINYPGLPIGVTAQRKDYFFDGAAGLYQTFTTPPDPADAESVNAWFFPTQRRGGRMLYGFDISDPAKPTLLWSAGCPNANDDNDCFPKAMSQIGQTWSVPNAAFLKGYSKTAPVLILGGGYDPCDDTDLAITTCVSPKGNRVYVLDAKDGLILAELPTKRSVAADVTLVDVDFDGMVDHAYAADTGGNVYRIDFSKPGTNNPAEELGKGDWSITQIAETKDAYRKFLFGPAALFVGGNVYLALGSGDRERPLITNYPYLTPVKNRFYSFIDTFGTTPLPMDLDGSVMQDFSSGSDCDSLLGAGKLGWYIDLDAGDGEQTVTSSVIFGGTIFFSTNRPIKTAAGSCASNLGEARGYALNLLNASGVIGSGALCGGSRSGTFSGGGIPPSPVVGTVPVKDPVTGKEKLINVLIGGIDLTTGGGSPIGAQQPPIPIAQVRSRIYWYPGGER